MSVHVAGVTKNQGFSLAGSHDLDPLRLLSACVFFQVFESPDVMDLDLVRHAGCFALFAHLGQ